MRILFDDFDDLFDLIVTHGKPITYGHYDGAWKLGDTVAAVETGGLRAVHAPGLRASNDETETVSFTDGDDTQLISLLWRLQREVQAKRPRA